ncbi:hypothetical protein BDZ45DRAFT_741699 [Acephala macrosclerotiorum]|nr:hypothetical protein BDZ45DRAFT_741699 [Acephala macrosclerotiorum]
MALLALIATYAHLEFDGPAEALQRPSTAWNEHHRPICEGEVQRAAAAAAAAAIASESCVLFACLLLFFNQPRRRSAAPDLSVETDQLTQEL